MQALRIVQETADDGCLHVRIPAGMGKRFELIVLPLDDAAVDESMQQMQAQEQGGFVQTVLAAPEEDVWNEL